MKVSVDLTSGATSERRLFSVSECEKLGQVNKELEHADTRCEQEVPNVLMLGKICCVTGYELITEVISCNTGRSRGYITNL